MAGSRISKYQIPITHIGNYMVLGEALSELHDFWLREGVINVGLNYSGGLNIELD